MITITGNALSPRTILFYPELVPFLDGDVLAALLLSQVLYWYRPSEKTGKTKIQIPKYGKYWIAKSVSEWGAETGMSANQVRRAMTVLIDRNVVVSELWKFNNVPTSHYRLTAANGTRMVINGCDPQFIFGSLNCGPAHSHLLSSTNLFVPEHKSITEITQETTAEITLQNSCGIIAGEIQGGIQGESKVGGIPKSDKIDVQTKEKKDMDAKDIMSKFAQDSKSLQVKTSSTGVKAMTLAWKKAVALEVGGYAKPLTGKEAGQLQHVYKALGEAALPALYHALGNWESFALEVGVQTGVSPAMSPNIGFFCTHHQVAVNQMNKPKSTKGKAFVIAQSIAVAPKYATVQTGAICNNMVHDQKATIDDVKASLEALAAIVAANSNT